MYDKGMYDMDRQLPFLLDGGEEEQPELFCDFTGRDGKVSHSDLSAAFPGNLWVSDSLCFCQFLSGRVSPGEGRSRKGGVVHPLLLCGNAGGILQGAEIGIKEL